MTAVGGVVLGPLSERATPRTCERGTFKAVQPDLQQKMFAVGFAAMPNLRMSQE